MSDRLLVAEQARGVMNHHARTFSAAAAFLAPGARDEIAVVYALCRKIDDLVDEYSDFEGLEAIAEQLQTREATDPLVAAFLAIADQRGIPVDAMLHLVDGARSDYGAVRIADPSALVRYGYLVAGAVGRVVCPLLGVADRAAVPFAVDLGVGMQLSNIARDVTEDAVRGRVYLPTTWLIQEGVDPEAVVHGTADPHAIMRVVARTVALAERYYDSAQYGYRFLPFRPRSVVVVAARRYREIGRKAVDRGPEALRSRTVVGASRAVLLTLSAPIAALAAGWSPLPAHDRRLHLPLAGLYSAGSSP
jgi:15-cis-phytoene synthase